MILVKYAQYFQYYYPGVIFAVGSGQRHDHVLFPHDKSQRDGVPELIHMKLHLVAQDGRLIVLLKG